MVNVFVYLFIYLHKDLPADCFSVSVGDFSPINGAFCIGTHSLFFIYLCKYCIFLVYSLHIWVCGGWGGGGSITTQMVKCTRSHSLIVLQATKYLDLSNSVNNAVKLDY